MSDWAMVVLYLVGVMNGVVIALALMPGVSDALIRMMWKRATRRALRNHDSDWRIAKLPSDDL